MRSITWKNILHQLRADLIGKDSYRGVTLTYSWMANQFGHFSLGFIPTLIVYSFLNKQTTSDSSSFKAAVYVSIFWFVFETYNFLGPLISNKRSASRVLFIKQDEYKFPPAWGNIAFDTVTDLGFFWFGAFSASMFLNFSWNFVVILLVLFVALLYPSYYWFLTKMYQQFAHYPFQFRLSQWDVDIDEGDIKTVNRFLNSDTSGNHLLIFGGRRSGKTSLSVGIGTEISIRHKPCIYTTGMKLYNMFNEPDEKLLNVDALWTWRTASLLIIDDINPGHPVPEDLVTPEDFLRLLDASPTGNQQNRKTIREKNVIWVLGTVSRKPQVGMTWKGMLDKIGVPPGKINSIDLKEKFLP